MEGLDANYVEISETITMSGIARVTTTAVFLRLNHVQVITAGSGGENAGVITVDSGAATDVLSDIAIGVNRSRLSHYTIPAGFTAYVKQISIYARDTKAAVVEFRARTLGGVWIAYRRAEASAGQMEIVLDYSLDGLVEKTDVKLFVASVTANDSVVGGAYTLLLIPN